MKNLKSVIGLLEEDLRHAETEVQAKATFRDTLKRALDVLKTPSMTARPVARPMPQATPRTGARAVLQAIMDVMAHSDKKTHTASDLAKELVSIKRPNETHTQFVATIGACLYNAAQATNKKVVRAGIGRYKLAA